MMNNGLLHEANEALLDLKRKHTRLTSQLESLKQFSGWNLSTEGKRPSGRVYYDVTLKGSRKKSYLGGEKHKQVLNVKRYRYAEKALSILDNDIRLLESLIEDYVTPDYSTINDLLPMTYRTNLETGDVSPSGMPAEAIKWMKRQKEEKAKYPPYKPEQLKHRAMDGTMMRSKSEVIIANMLIQAGIPFVYEVPISINGEMLLPDFTILSLIDLKTVIIIEHQGMVFLESYANKFIKSLKLYLQSEWIPNKNLFFTFDDARETLDPRQVTTILRKFIDPSL